jgi:hypothetical protein
VLHEGGVAAADPNPRVEESMDPCDEEDVAVLDDDALEPLELSPGELGRL